MTARARVRNPHAYRWIHRKESRKPCPTPGCPIQTQTGGACHMCRKGFKKHLRAEAA